METYNFATDAGSAYSNFVGATPAASTYTAQSYGYTPAPASSGSSWTSWIAPTLNGLTGLAQTGGQIYAAATAKQPKAPKYNQTVIAPAKPAGSNNVLIIGVLAAVGLIVAVIAFRPKRGK